MANGAEETLPPGWVETTLGAVARVEWGNTSITKKSYVIHGYPAFSAAGEDGFLPLYEWEGSGVVLSAIGARCGRCFVAKGKWTAIKNTIVIQVSEVILLNQFLFLYVNNARRWHIGGSGQPFITLQNARTTAIPLPPLAEQRRIVEKLDAILPLVEAVRDRLAKIPARIKAFRQAVLAAACSGKLTEDWRGAGSEGAEGMPEGWEKRTVGQLISVPLRNGKSVNDANDGFAVLRLNCLQSGKVNRNIHKLGKIKIETFNQYLIKKGDILIARGNGSLALVGRAGLVVDEEPKVSFPDTLIQLRTNHSICIPDFLIKVWESSGTRSQLEERAKTSAGIWKLSQSNIESLVIPLAPLPEQKEIVRRVDELFALADRILEKYESLKRRADALPQAILARAFRGELAPQDPNDEPASVLLERIRAERAQAAQADQAAKKARPKTRPKSAATPARKKRTTKPAARTTRKVGKTKRR
jgi:restriction endonuclease S subunit